MRETQDSNAHIVLARRPSGPLGPECFDYQACEYPRRAPDQVLLAVEYLAMDPYLRGLIAGRHLDSAPEPGQRMPGQGLAVVLEAPKSSGLKPGDRVITDSGWARFVTKTPEHLRHPGLPDDLPPPSALGILGMPGLTAWAGLHRIAGIRTGEVVAVSSASGTVGAAVLQLAKAQGCVTVGITSESKRSYVEDRLGADFVLSRDRDLISQLEASQIPRFDVAFDNSGGAVLEAMLGHLALHARMVLCGMISQYDCDQRPPGPNLGPVIAARASLRGLVVYDHFDAMPEYLDHAIPLYRDGRLRCQETIFEGLASAPEALCALLSGRTRGRVLVRVDGSDRKPIFGERP